MARILLAEGNQIFKTVLKKALIEHGNFVDEMPSVDLASGALDSIHRTAPYDLIISSVVYKQEEGNSTTGLADLYPRIAGMEIPIIVTAAPEEDHIITALKKEGADIRHVVYKEDFGDKSERDTLLEKIDEIAPKKEGHQTTQGRKI